VQLVEHIWTLIFIASGHSIGGNNLLIVLFAVDLFHFFAVAQKLGGYDKVTAIACIYIYKKYENSTFVQNLTMIIN